MRLKSLHIQNFRALEDFKVKKLGHVNLIVGKNNSGKSSVLEAVRIYAGNADPYLLSSISESHDEKFSPSDNESFPFEHFFTNRCFPSDEKQSITIGEIDKASDSLRLQHTYLIEETETITLDNGETRTSTRLKPTLEQPVFDFVDKSTTRHAILATKNQKSLLIDPKLFEGRRLSRVSEFPLDVFGSIPCQYIPTAHISSADLASYWDNRIVLSGIESLIIDKLKFIEPNCEKITFVEPKRGERFAVVTIKDIQKPIPLKSMGDGVFRVFQLALKAFSAKDGFLLIDEFENGLHWTVQEKVWEWLFELSKSLNIQIFATTHSNDCVRSFSKVASQKKDGVMFRVGQGVKKEDIGKIVATDFSEEELAIILANKIEVR